MRILYSLLLILTVAGCSSFTPSLPEPEVRIKTVTEFRTLDIYQPPLPKEIGLQDVEFFVVTEKNFEEQLKRLQKIQDGTYVLFGLTPQDYENMAYNLQELRRYIRQQKEIIIYYRKATQSDEGTDSQDWIERNQEVLEDQQSE